MKKPIAIISNDWHLQSNNIEKIEDLVDQQIELGKKLDVKYHFVLGDIFQSRISQRQDVLVTFSRIVEKFRSFDKLGRVKFVVGNHDKTDYTSEDSFLAPYEYGVVSDYEELDIIEGVRIHFMPFFLENVWIEKFKPNLLKGGKNVLLTHVGFNGSVNNDGSKVESPIKPSLFKNFDLVLSGHYHNRHQVAVNIEHLPSICQHNFGENEEKGFTILYNDLSYKVVQSDFPKYHKFTLDAGDIKENCSKIIADVLSLKNQNPTDNYRLEIVGKDTEINTLDISLLANNGVSITKKVSDIEASTKEESIEIKQFSREDLTTEFKEFCEKEGLDFEQGSKYLQTHLEK